MSLCEPVHACMIHSLDDRLEYRIHLWSITSNWTHLPSKPCETGAYRYPSPDVFTERIRKQCQRMVSKSDAWIMFQSHQKKNMHWTIKKLSWATTGNKEAQWCIWSHRRPLVQSWCVCHAWEGDPCRMIKGCKAARFLSFSFKIYMHKCLCRDV